MDNVTIICMNFLSFIESYYFNIMSTLILFPTYETVTNYRKRLITEYLILFYLFDDNKGRKMEDLLPLKLFNMQTILKIMETDDFHLLLSMLPTTLLLESLHRKELNISATIDYLLFGANIIMIYYIMQKHVIEDDLDIYTEIPSMY